MRSLALLAIAISSAASATLTVIERRRQRHQRSAPVAWSSDLQCADIANNRTLLASSWKVFDVFSEYSSSSPNGGGYRTSPTGAGSARDLAEQPSISDEEICGWDRPPSSQKEGVETSPSGRWVWVRRRQERGQPMLLLCSTHDDEEDENEDEESHSKQQQQPHFTFFSDPIDVPALYEVSQPQAAAANAAAAPTARMWMSHTPNEVVTLLPLARQARGRTVVVGLGLGWLLHDVSWRPAVREVVLVERDAELVEWLLPRLKDPRGGWINPWLLKTSGGSSSSSAGSPPTGATGASGGLTVKVGDAAAILPTLEADVALVDIFPDYGGEQALAQLEALRAASPGIKQVIGWGLPNR